MKKFKAFATVNGATLGIKEDDPYKAAKEATGRIDSAIYQAMRNLQKQPEGTKVSLTFGVDFEVAMNRRAPRRPAAVIAAEKAARATRVAAQAPRHDWRAEAEKVALRRQQRIKSQIDHAFLVGQSGKEPVAKYITCQHCDDAAAYLELNRVVPQGSMKLDESTIIGALCAGHGQSPYNGHNVVQKFPCNRLEFFYAGQRMITIKAKP